MVSACENSLLFVKKHLSKQLSKFETTQERHMVEFLRPSLWDISHAEKLILKAKPKLKDDAVELAKQASLLLRMHNLVVKYNLTACVRSVYDRAAFQSAKSNGKWIQVLHG
jgi:SPX domain protein involved in polyphosphate accumulation